MSALIAIIQVCACFGFGAAILKALNTNKFNMPLEHLAWAGTIGMGLLGWLMFFVGLAGAYTPVIFVFTLGLGCCGLIFFRPAPVVTEINWAPSLPLNSISFTLLFLIAAVFTLDIIEALAPPTDADSLAYHYAIPSQFLDAGKIVFIPRAVDGATPLLVQMTYLPVLSLGGDQALTLWAMLSGHLLTLLLFTVARQYMNTTWSLALIFLLISSPAFIYGSVNGQVEVRNAAFVLASAIALVQGIKTSQIRWFIVAGITAGFFMGAKYIGLFYVAAAGLSLLICKPSYRPIIAFSLSVAVSGTQWYFWIWLNTGDPVFPALYGLVPYSNPMIWNKEINEFFKYRLEHGENTLPKTPLWMLAYPFIATFANNPILQGGRVGFGITAFILAPAAIFAAYTYRHHFMRHPLRPIVSIVLIFYMLWYFIGGSQRVRHFMPIYPLALFVLMFAATKWATMKTHARLIGAMLVPVIAMQIGAQIIYAREAITYQFDNVSKTTYLLRNVSDFGLVPWINANLPENAHVLSNLRQLEYHMKPKMFFHDDDQALIEVQTPMKSPVGFWRQMRNQNITHALVLVAPGNEGDQKNQIWKVLMLHDCGIIVHRGRTMAITSRALKTLGTNPKEAFVIKLTPESCTFE